MSERRCDLRVAGEIRERRSVGDGQFVRLALDGEEAPLSIADPDGRSADSYVGDRVVVDVEITGIESIEADEEERREIVPADDGVATIRGALEANALSDDVVSALVDAGTASVSVPYHRGAKLTAMNDVAASHGIDDAAFVRASGVELVLGGVERVDEGTPFAATPLTDVEFEIERDASFEEQVADRGSHDPLVDFRLRAGEADIVGADDYMTSHLTGLLDSLVDVLAGESAEHEFLVENLRYEFRPVEDGVRMQYFTGDVKLNRDLPNEGIHLDRTALAAAVLRAARKYHDAVRRFDPDHEEPLDSLRDAIRDAERALARTMVGESNDEENPATESETLPSGTVLARVVDRSPEAVYQGTVHTQRVVLDVNGVRFGVFDPTVQLAESHLESWALLELTWFMAELERPADRESGISPDANSRDWRNHTIVGTTRRPAESDEANTLYLGVEGGEVSVTVVASDQDGSGDDFVVRDGERVAATAARVDLSNVAAVLDPAQLVEVSDAEFESDDVETLRATATDRAADRAERIAAIRELGGRPGTEALDALAECARRARDGSVADAAVEALASVDDSAAVDALGEVLVAEETPPETRRRALRALRRRENGRASPAVREIVREGDDPDVRRLGAAALSALDGDQAFEPLQAVLDDDPDEAVVQEAAAALARTEHPAVGDEFLDRIRTAEDPAVRTAVLRTVNKEREWAGDVAIEALYDEADEIRRLAISRVQWLDDPRTVDPLCRLVRSSDDPTIRAKAAGAFGNIDRSTLDADRRRYAAETLADALDDHDERVRARALSGIAEHHHPVAFEPVLEVAQRDEDEQCLAGALRAIWAFGDDRATPVVVDRLEHESPRVREKACTACGRLDVEAAIDRLLELAAEDENVRVREQALSSIGSVFRHGGESEGDEERVVERVHDLARDEGERRVRREAVRSLATLADRTPSATVALVQIANSETDEEIRNRAEKALDRP